MSARPPSWRHLVVCAGLLASLGLAVAPAAQADPPPGALTATDTQGRMLAVWSDGSRLLTSRKPPAGGWTAPHLITEAPFPTQVAPLQLVQSAAGDALVEFVVQAKCQGVGFVHLSTRSAQTLGLQLDTPGPTDCHHRSGDQRGQIQQLQMGVGSAGDAFVTYVHKAFFDDRLVTISMPAGGGSSLDVVEDAQQLVVRGLTLVISPGRFHTATIAYQAAADGASWIGVRDLTDPQPLLTGDFVSRGVPTLVQDAAGAQTLSFAGRLRASDGSLGRLSTLVATRAQPLVVFGPFAEQPLL